MKRLNDFAINTVLNHPERFSDTLQAAVREIVLQRDILNELLGMVFKPYRPTDEIPPNLDSQWTAGYNEALSEVRRRIWEALKTEKEENPWVTASKYN